MTKTSKSKSKSQADASIPVHIYFVLDATGSMNKIKSDVIGGFNHWLAKQQSTPGECRLTMIHFHSGDPHRLVYDAVPIAEVAPLTDDTYQCASLTPLLDAEGWMIAKASGREAERLSTGLPAEAIVFATYTDGDENHSKEYTFADITALRTAKEAAGWAFTYLGVGHDAYGQAARIGTHKAATRSHANNAEGVAASFADADHAVTQVRTFAAKGQRVESARLYEGSRS